MNKPPEIIIGPHGIENWQAIHHWAEANDPVWRRCLETYHHLSKKRFLETLTAYLLQARIETLEECVSRLKRPSPWNFDWSADQ